MAKKKQVDVEALKAKLATVQEAIEELAADAEVLSFNTTLSDAEAVQRLFLLISRDATQAAVRLYGNIRIARTNALASEE